MLFHRIFIRRPQSLLLAFALACVTPVLSAQTAALSPGPATNNQPCCGPITAEGRRLLTVLDSMDVEHKWLAHEHVNWLSGEADRPANYTGLDRATHCSAFAAAVGYRLGVYILRPPEHPQQLLASAQGEWLAADAGRAAGWTLISDAVHAQHLANMGAFVVVDYVSPDPHTPGHIAIIRPSEKTAAELAQDGPDVTQAGATNRTRWVAAHSFDHHPGAWPNNVRYFSHPVQWSSVPAQSSPAQVSAPVQP